MGWRVVFVSALFCAGSFGWPSLLGASSGDHSNQYHHAAHDQTHPHHQDQDYDYLQPSEDISVFGNIVPAPLQGLYSSPPEEIPEPESLYEAPPVGVSEVTGLATTAIVMDPSYYFEYRSQDSQRSEDADSSGNIIGSYGFNTPGGSPVEVRYRAGPDTGFVIENMEELWAAAEAAASEDILLQPQPYAGATAEISFRQPMVDPATLTQDSSYSYGYSTSGLGRQETSDSEGNVQGSYRYTAADGSQMEVHYIAGAETGYVVQSVEEVSGHMSNIKSTVNSVTVDFPELLYEAPPKDILPLDVEVPEGLYNAPPPDSNLFISAPSETSIVEESEVLYTSPLEDNAYSGSEVEYDDIESDNLNYDADVKLETTTMFMDKSYNFAYSGEEARRQEEANPTGIIHGQYSYVNAEGNEIVVKYKAGADIGFVIENQEELNAAVRRATNDGSVAAVAARKALENNQYHSSPVKAEVDPLPIASGSEEFTNLLPSYSKTEGLLRMNSITKENTPNIIASYDQGNSQVKQPTEMDASFKYKVNEVDHTFEEEADSTGERTGSYTYVNPSGDTIGVRYRAGRRGFVILNPDQVLPRSPFL